MALVSIAELIGSLAVPIVLLLVSKKKFFAQIMWIIVLYFVLFGSGKFIVFHTSDDAHFVDISRLQFEIFVLTIFLLIIAIFALIQHRKNLELRVFATIPLLIFVTIFDVVMWLTRSIHGYDFSGYIQIFTYFLTWCVGYYVGKNPRTRAKWTIGTLSVVAVILVSKLLEQIFNQSGSIGNVENTPYSFYWKDASEASVFIGLLMISLMPTLLDKHRKYRIMGWSLFALFFVMDIFTWSRPGITGMVLTFIIFVVIASYKKDLQLLKNKKSLFALIVAILVIIGIFGSHLIVNLSPRSDDVIQKDLLSLAWNSWTSSPWNFLFGNGVNHFSTDLLRNSSYGLALGYPVHSSVMLLLCELGLVGSLLFFIPIIYVFVKGIGEIRTRNPFSTTAIAMFGFAVIELIFGFHIVSGPTGILFFFILGRILGKLRLYEGHPVFNLFKSRITFRVTFALATVILIATSVIFTYFYKSNYSLVISPAKAEVTVVDTLQNNINSGIDSESEQEGI
ncbi:MAG: hypothetical protein LBM13_06340 [Candidatus Ancillula sp.]|jgi:hypothetical protein|nr:hypothetical protein [Candidatus Ancillula sp.]